MTTEKTSASTGASSTSEPDTKPSSDIAGMTKSEWSGKPMWACVHCNFDTFDEKAAKFHSDTAHPGKNIKIK